MDGEFCPGDFTVSRPRRVKLIGTAQRVVRHASLLAASVAVTDGAALRAVLTDVYAALELDWDPATAGAIEDDVPGATLDAVEQAILETAPREVTEGSLDAETLRARARALVPRHTVDSGGAERTRRGGHAGRSGEHDQQRRPQRERDRGGGHAGEPRIDHHGLPSATVCPTTSAASRHGREQRHDERDRARQRAAGEDHRPGALEGDCRRADREDGDPHGGHDATSCAGTSSAMIAPAAAATIGRPGGSSGVSASAISAPATAATRARGELS